MTRRTKIVCTLGPAVDSREGIESLIGAGMNVARLNCSHGDWETRRRWIDWIRDLSPKAGPIAILVDLQGPKFRLGLLRGDAITLKAGQRVSIGGTETELPVGRPEILAGFERGATVLIADGSVEIRLADGEGDAWQAEVVSGGTVRSRQGITLVGRSFACEIMSEKDRHDAHEAVRLGVDYLALSYVRSSADVGQLGAIVGESGVRICAKIETKEALEDLEAIVDAVDLVMVARGDLGLQMPIESVPLAQKKIIARCAQMGKPVITATQMLESMIQNPRPTRAEASDVANAILDGTDAVMLSAETAMGAYPVECVRTMARIAHEVESSLDRERIERDFEERSLAGATHTEAVAHAVAELATRLKPKAILMTSASGQTPRRVSKFRPEAPMLCVTWSDRVCSQLAALWGVEAVSLPVPGNTDEAVDAAIRAFVDLGRLQKGDLVIVTAGVPVGTPGHTNLILTQVI